MVSGGNRNFDFAEAYVLFWESVFVRMNVTLTLRVRGVMSESLSVTYDMTSLGGRSNGAKVTSFSPFLLVFRVWRGCRQLSDIHARRSVLQPSRGCMFVAFIIVASSVFKRVLSVKNGSMSLIGTIMPSENGEKAGSERVDKHCPAVRWNCRELCRWMVFAKQKW